MAKLDHDPIVVLNETWCKRCGLCISVCPFHVFEPNEEGLPLLVKLDKCTECQLCELICPDFALEVGPLKHASKVKGEGFIPMATASKG